EKDLTPPASDRLALKAVNIQAIRNLITDSRHIILLAFTNTLSARLGFPVVLSSPRNNTVEELAAIKRDLNGVLTALQDPVWKSDQSGTQSGVANYCSNAVAVLSALIKDGRPVQWQLVFVPPPENAPEGDRNIIKILPVANIGGGSLQKTMADLSKCDST